MAKVECNYTVNKNKNVRSDMTNCVCALSAH